MATSKFTKPNHGTTVTIKGKEYLFLDDGGFKGLYLSEKKAALVMASTDKIKLFITGQQEKAKAKASQDPAIAALEKRIADLTAMLGATRATAVTTPVVPGRIDPLAGK